ncbi:MAG: hypothetical protein GF398_19770 [Chitinivibrionales bacterium]|nr:hypothetical protein [Chitinivibrionales bacterium]
MKQKVFLFLSISIIFVHADLIAFNSYLAPNVTHLTFSDPYFEEGYQISSNIGSDFHGVFSKDLEPLVTSNNGSDFFAWCGYCDSELKMTLERADSELFSITGFDIAHLAVDQWVPGLSIIATGHLEDGGQVSQAFKVEENAWEHYSFLPSFKNLVSLDLEAVGGEKGQSVSIDNLVVNRVSVPEPSSLAYLIMCIPALLIFKRKHK